MFLLYINTYIVKRVIYILLVHVVMYNIIAVVLYFLIFMEHDIMIVYKRILYTPTCLKKLVFFVPINIGWTEG